MEELLSVTLCDPLDFDENIFLSWLKGLKSQEAAEAHIQDVSRYWTQDMDNEGSNIFSVSQQKASGLYDLLEAEILDHYNSYEVLEHYICQPSWLLTNQIMIRIPDHIIQWVICQYYTLDNQVARTLLGKRLFKNRRELEDMSENCDIPLISVTRQFENLHRIYLSLEELQFQVNFKGFIGVTYALPPNLSRKYACLLFLVAGRFDVSSKKRLQRLTCQELENCAAASMACLLPDLSTFLQHKSGSFDDEDLDMPPECELHEMMLLAGNPPLTTAPLATEAYSIPLYTFSGGLNKSKSQHGLSVEPTPRTSSNGQEIPSDLPRPLSHGRSQSAPLSSHTNEERLEQNLSPWLGICRLLTHPAVYATEPDKQLLANLRELRTMFTGEVMEGAIAHLKKVLLTMQRGDIIVRKLDIKVKSVLKSLTSIGGHLSQSKEYRDIYDDILNIVGESLQEAGLDREEANSFLIACNAMIAGIKDSLYRKLDRTLDNTKKLRKINIIEMDWIRFVLCCRICLWNMFDVLQV